MYSNVIEKVNSILDEYVPSQYREKDKFITFCKIFLIGLILIGDRIDSLANKYNIDEAVGKQLDDLGAWFGVSRTISIPIPNPFFEWGNQNYLKGWGYAPWKQPQDTIEGLTTLPDEAFRAFIKSRIALNKWDGSMDQLNELLGDLIVGNKLIIKDNCDMSMDYLFFGNFINPVMRAIIKNNYILVKPAGVYVNTVKYVENKAFAWGINNNYFGGWGDGQWAQPI